MATGDILVAALNRGYINETIGNRIWTNMIIKRRILPTRTFTEYLQKIMDINLCKSHWKRRDSFETELG